MFELVVERTECLVFLLIYKIFKRGFLHDSKRADIPLVRPLPTGHRHRRRHTTNALDGDGLSQFFRSQVPRSRTSGQRAQDRIIRELERIIPRPRSIHLQVQTDIEESPLRPNRKGC